MANKSKTPKAKTYEQVRAIFGSAKDAGLNDEALRDVVESVTARTRSIKELTHAEADKVIARLKGSSNVPRRTLQYRRRKAGVEQLVQAKHLELIIKLAAQRDWTNYSLTKFCMNVIKRGRPITANQANKVIEGLKAMNRRDNLWAA